MAIPANARDFAKRYTAAWCSRNAASVAAFFSPNGSITINSGAPAMGREAVVQMAQGFITAFPDLELLMDDLIIQGDRAAYHWTFIGTNTGPGGTGRRIRFSGFELWQFAPDGLIAESQGNFDSADYQRQLEHASSLPAPS